MRTAGWPACLDILRNWLLDLTLLTIYFAVPGCLTRMAIFSDTMGGSNG
jgi:hypothetical protein